MTRREVAGGEAPSGTPRPGRSNRANAKARRTHGAVPIRRVLRPRSARSGAYGRGLLSSDRSFQKANVALGVLPMVRHAEARCVRRSRLEHFENGGILCSCAKRVNQPPNCCQGVSREVRIDRLHLAMSNVVAPAQKLTVEPFVVKLKRRSVERKAENYVVELVGFEIPFTMNHADR